MKPKIIKNNKILSLKFTFYLRYDVLILVIGEVIMRFLTSLFMFSQIKLQQTFYFRDFG